jgi:diguanylate cyclase (GGDEF)-like protein/PAS domain S-box-containing protein
MQGIPVQVMNSIKRQIRSLLPPLAAVVAVTMLALWLHRIEGGKSLPALWLANGICLAVLMHRGRRGAVALVAAACCIIAFAAAASGVPVGDSLVGALGNALEMSIALSALSRKDRATYLETPYGTKRFIIWALLIAPLASTLAILPYLILTGHPRHWEIASFRVISHALGTALAVPLTMEVLRWHREPPLSRRRTRRCVQALLGLIGASALAFGQPALPLLFIVFPPLVLLTLTGNRRWVIAGIIAVATVGAVLTTAGYGPIHHQAPFPAWSAMLLQLYVLSGMAVVLPLTASLEQRRRLGRTLRGSEARYRMLAEHSHDIVLLLGADGYCKYVSPAIHDMLGYPAAKMVESSLESLIDDDSQAIARELWTQLLQGQPPTTALLRMRHADGSFRSVEATGGVIDEEPDRVVLTLRDVSARVAAEDALRHERLMTDVTLQVIGDAVFTLDRDGKLQFANPAGRALLDRSVAPDEQVLEQQLPLWREGERLTQAHPASIALHTGMPQGPFLCALELKDETRHAIECSATPIRSSTGGVMGAVLVLRDVSAVLELSERMAQLAHFDALTGLPNRSLLLERLDIALARAKQTAHHLAVLFIDLDRFKQINDTLGHGPGDELLQQVADRLSSVVKSVDTVARLGGDEFVVLLPELSGKSEAAIAATRALEVLSKPIRIGRRELQLSASIGVSMFPDDGDDADVLIRHADIAMYAAKRHGRNDYHFYAAAMEANAQKEFDLENALRFAITRAELFLEFQPRIDTGTRKIISSEALMRWRRPDGEVCLPNEFIPIAEASGLILSMGNWVLKEACRACKAWQHGSLQGVSVSVNISQLQFVRDNFLSLVMESLRETGLPPHLLELELTESMLMEPSESIQQRIAGLSALGVKLSIDDFGTGFSSLAYLRRFAIDTLKIDRSFVMHMTDDPEDASVIHAIIALAISLGKRVVAEGVETMQQASQLAALGCHEMQGHWLGRPGDVAQLAELARRGTHSVSARAVGH